MQWQDSRMHGKSSTVKTSFLNAWHACAVHQVSSRPCQHAQAQGELKDDLQAPQEQECWQTVSWAHAMQMEAPETARALVELHPLHTPDRPAHQHAGATRSRPALAATSLTAVRSQTVEEYFAPCRV